MYKASIELAKINKMMKLKFGLIIRSDDEIKNPNSKIVSKFNYYGNDYLRINPKPFINIDISSSMNKGEGWNSNQVVSLNRYSLFRFIQALKKIITDFQSIRNLFYYNNTELVVDNILAEKYTIQVKTSSSKIVCMRPCVVPDEENQEYVYEGCIFFINGMENFAYITYTEMEYLLWELMRVDMTSLSIQVLELVKLYEAQKSQKINIPPVSEKENPLEVEMVSPSTVTIVQKNTIPQI